MPSCLLGLPRAADSHRQLFANAAGLARRRVAVRQRAVLVHWSSAVMTFMMRRRDLVVRQVFMAGPDDE